MRSVKAVLLGTLLLGSLFPGPADSRLQPTSPPSKPAPRSDPAPLTGPRLRELWAQSHHVVSCEIVSVLRVPGIAGERGSATPNSWIAECRLIRAYLGPMRKSIPGLAFRVRFEEPAHEQDESQPHLLRPGKPRLLFLRAPAGLKYLQEAPPPSSAPPFRLTDPAVGALELDRKLEDRVLKLTD